MLQLDSSDTVFGVLPFFHAGGLITLLFMLIQGVRLLINSRFEPRKFLEIIQQYKVTI